MSRIDGDAGSGRMRRAGRTPIARCVLLLGCALTMSVASAQQPADPLSSKTDGATTATVQGGASTATKPAATGALDLSPTVLKSAVDAADADYARTDTRSTFGAVSASQGTAVEQAFKVAGIEICGKADGAFRFEPPVIGPVPLGGMLVAPHWLNTIATGRCRL